MTDIDIQKLRKNLVKQKLQAKPLLLRTLADAMDGSPFDAFIDIECLDLLIEMGQIVRIDIIPGQISYYLSNSAGVVSINSDLDQQLINHLLYKHSSITSHTVSC